MKNITLAIDDDVLDKVRVYAARTEDDRSTPSFAGISRSCAGGERQPGRGAPPIVAAGARRRRGRHALPTTFGTARSSMTVQCFVDTNILIYAARPKDDEPRKFAVATDVFTERALLPLDPGFTGILCRGSKELGQRPWRCSTEPEASEWVGWLEPFCEVVDGPASSFQQAIETARRHRIAYWDAAIFAAAARASAPILYSEDLSHGQSYGDVQVINPFLI